MTTVKKVALTEIPIEELSGKAILRSAGHLKKEIDKKQKSAIMKLPPLWVWRMDASFLEGVCAAKHTPFHYVRMSGKDQKAISCDIKYYAIG